MQTTKEVRVRGSTNACASTKVPALHRSIKQRCASVNTAVTTPPAAKKELRVCTSRTCRKQGSPEVLKFLQDLAQDTEGIRVRECSCLGNCGNGPNMALMPEGRELAHVATLDDATRVLTQACGVAIPEPIVQALALKQQGNAAAIAGRLDEAAERYSAGIAMNPSAGLHLLLCNRASVYLQQGRCFEALGDAQQAVQLAPPSFVNGWVRLVDCLYAVGRHEEAAETVQVAVQKCPQFRAAPEYRVIVQALRKEGCNV
ncbi:hypothetical protein DUNSADRAFT_15615 [Dunaliella salina]|uniref:Uncharacterized protein n=1 Tax=Dunaliella salina TaxID=3046 RepID=A0ABQ7H1L8_DUNSA|nr:hypothetical protein DUNSADRAFT_15615 [Dunaliella salina]|eukprot:KAF5840757.1 hypothetical protein DUNSADRAFT_15615 [Dunaliella salina]